MINDILTAVGVEGINYRRARFSRPPEGNYAVYHDDIDVEAPDPVTPPTQEGLPRIYHHTVTVELYESKPDDAVEAAIEAELDARGIPWAKEDRYWLQDAQRYQVIYEFSYITKS